MNLRHIEIIHAVYVTGSVSAGARMLNVSQPTVSNILKHAEDVLGFKVFDRIKGRLYPTEQGRKLFEEIQPIFKQLNSLEQAIHKIATVPSDALRVAMIPAIGLDLGPRAITTFCKRHEHIRVETETKHSADIIRALHQNEIDIGLVYDAPKSPGLVSQNIAQIDFVLISSGSETIKNNTSVKLSNIPAQNLIMLNPKSLPGRYLNRRLKSEIDHVAYPRIIVETYHLAKSLVRHGAGVAIVDRLTAASGDKDHLIIQDLEPRISVSLDVVYRPTDSSLQHITGFVDTLQKLHST